MIGEMSTPPVLGRKLRIGRKKRLRQRQEQVPDRANEIVADVDDAERDQPGEDGACDDDPGVEIEDDHHDVEDRAHEFSQALRGRS